MRQAVALAEQNLARGGRPFGAVLVQDGRVIATGVNDIVHSHDPTRHAELDAIRAASQVLGRPRLDGCVVYASGQPCPMCLAAMYLCGIRAAYFAGSNADGAPYGLSTEAVYAALRQPLAQQPLPVAQLPLPEGDTQPQDLYRRWHAHAQP